MTLEVDEDGCGHLHLDLPADATNAEIGYIKTLVERVGSALLELHDLPCFSEGSLKELLALIELRSQEAHLPQE